MTLTRSDLQEIKALFQENNTEIFPVINDLVAHTDGQIQELSQDTEKMRDDITDLRVDLTNLQSEVLLALLTSTNQSPVFRTRLSKPLSIRNFCLLIQSESVLLTNHS